jgi:hypothetical protein
MYIYETVIIIQNNHDVWNKSERLQTTRPEGVPFYHFIVEFRRDNNELVHTIGDFFKIEGL